MRPIRLVIAVAVACAALVVPSSALAQIDSVSAGDATLGPDGASLTLPIIVQCDPGFTFIGVLGDVFQRKGNRLIRGSGSVFPFPAVACTGQPQTFTMEVSNFSPFRFQNGRGTVTVTVGLTSPTGGLVIQTFGPFDIRIRNK